MVKIEENFKHGAEIILHCGDSLKFLQTVPSETVQLVITSPPYNIGKEYETKTSIESYLNNQSIIIKELVRILKSQGSICWQVGNCVNNAEVFPLDVFYYPIFKSLDLKLRNRIIWRFGHGLHASKRFSGRYETISWYTKSDDYVFNLDKIRVPSKYPNKKHFKGPNRGKLSGNPLGKNPSDTWDFVAQEWDQQIWDIPNVKSNHPEKTSHPCSFPIELVERCVLAFTQDGDCVLDPYCGVGSTLIGGLLHNCQVIGVDKEKTYTDIACKRISDYFAGTLKIRPIGKPIHEPS